jgi:single-strand DNA-binding protein
MAGVNKAIVVGNLGADPELRHTDSGTPVCRLSVATSRQWTNKQTNETQQETEWHRITVWGKQAESCQKYLAKGRQVYVEGRIRTSSYEDENGVKKYSTEIVAEIVQFLGSKADNEGGGGGGGGGGGSSSKPSNRQPEPDPDDDIPF